jgi:hypothetical protein
MAADRLAAFGAIDGVIMTKRFLHPVLCAGLVAALSAHGASTEAFDREFAGTYRDMLHDAKAAYDGKRYDKALPLFTKAACAGDKESQMMLGRMHLMGQGTDRDDILGYAWMKVGVEVPFSTYPALVANIENSFSAEQRKIAEAEAKAKIEAYGLRATNMSCNKSASRGGHIMDSITCTPQVEGTSVLLKRCMDTAAPATAKP